MAESACIKEFIMTQALNFKRTKLACYAAYFTMSSVFCIPPLLFVTLRETYGISYTLLGTLVLVNFDTQLGVDLICTFFSKYINTKIIVRVMPLITTLGMSVYALIPTFFPSFAYGGLVIGTVIFSLSAGLSEALLSPVMATIPSDNPQRDMSFLHSLYAFGVLTMVVIGTLFIKLFGAENWMLLMLFLALLPVISAVLFAISPMPDMDSHGSSDGAKGTKRRAVGLSLCVGCIFFGSCAENGMSNWISGFMELALHIDKTLGDVLGVAMFAVLLGAVRIWYAGYGKNIAKVLLIGMAGSVVCYLVAGLVGGSVVPLIACVLVGLFSGLLWPGTLILMEEKLPGMGVTAYAFMAAGGDLGASVSPQLIGIMADKVAAYADRTGLAAARGLTPDQVGMKAGILLNAVFPFLGIFAVLAIMRYFRKEQAA